MRCILAIMWRMSRVSFDHERGAAIEVKLASVRALGPSIAAVREFRHGVEDALGEINDCGM
jgi:hypothetical protein